MALFLLTETPKADVQEGAHALCTSAGWHSHFRRRDSLQQLSPTAEQPAEALGSGTLQLNIFSLNLEPAALLEKPEGMWGFGPRCFTDRGDFLSFCQDLVLSHSVIIAGDVSVVNWSDLLIPV